MISVCHQYRPYKGFKMTYSISSNKNRKSIKSWVGGVVDTKNINLNNLGRNIVEIWFRLRHLELTRVHEGNCTTMRSRFSPVQLVLCRFHTLGTDPICSFHRHDGTHTRFWLFLRGSCRWWRILQHYRHRFTCLTVRSLLTSGTFELNPPVLRLLSCWAAGIQTGRNVFITLFMRRALKTSRSGVTECGSRWSFKPHLLLLVSPMREFFVLCDSKTQNIQ